MAYQTLSRSPAPQRPQGQSSPGYVSFSRLLDANRPGAKRMADTLAQGAQQQGQQSQQAIQAAGQKFTSQVQAGTLAYNAPSAPKGGTPAGGAGAGGGYLQAGAMQGNPAWTDAPARPQASQDMKEYQGPKDWAGAGIDTVGLATQAAKAGEAAQGLTSMGGRAAQLREGVRGPYGAGMSALDAALSGAALGTRGQELAQLYGGLNEQLANRQAAGGKEVEAAIRESADAVARMERDLERQRANEGAHTSSPAVPAEPPPAAPEPPPVQHIGTTPVPVGNTEQTQPVLVPGTNTVIQPGQQKPKQGGQWIGGVWVPYT